MSVSPQALVRNLWLMAQPRYVPAEFDSVNDLVAFLECSEALVPEYLRAMGIPMVENLRLKASDPELDDGDLVCSLCFCQRGIPEHCRLDGETADGLS